MEDCKQKIGGYIALYTYHLMNLVVKADPVSLLGVTVKTENGLEDIERVSVVFRLDDFHFAIVPREQENLLAIGKGVMETHPEFKQDVKKIVELNLPSSVSANEEDMFILLTMPEVNDDRYDVLKDGVNVLYDGVKIKVDSSLEEYKIKLDEKIISVTDEEKDEAKSALKELTELAEKSIDEYKAKKLAEIEEAHQKYLKERAEEESINKKEEKAHGKNAGMSMKLFGEDNE